MDFNGDQRIEGPDCSFSAASKASTWSQLRNKGLLNERIQKKYTKAPYTLSYNKQVASVKRPG